MELNSYKGKLLLGPFMLSKGKNNFCDTRDLINVTINLKEVQDLGLTEAQQNRLGEEIYSYLFFKEWLAGQPDLNACRDELKKLSRQGEALSQTMKALYPPMSLGTWPDLIKTYPSSEGVPPIDCSWSKQVVFSDVWNDVAEFTAILAKRANKLATAIKGYKTEDFALKYFIRQVGVVYQEATGKEWTCSKDVNKAGSFCFVIEAILKNIGYPHASTEALAQVVSRLRKN